MHAKMVIFATIEFLHAQTHTHCKNFSHQNLLIGPGETPVLKAARVLASE